MCENEEPKIFKAYREHKVLFTINRIFTAPTLAIYCCYRNESYAGQQPFTCRLNRNVNSYYILDFFFVMLLNCCKRLLVNEQWSFFNRYNQSTWEHLFMQHRHRRVCVTSIYYHLIWQIWKLQTLFNWNIIFNI